MQISRGRKGRPALTWIQGIAETTKIERMTRKRTPTQYRICPGSRNVALTGLSSTRSKNKS